MSTTPPKGKDSIDIISMLEAPSTDLKRTGKKDAFIVYRVNGIQTFNIQIPAENLTDALVRDAIVADFKKRGKIFSQSFEV